MTEAPRIAVIVPCFNDGELVAEAVSSVIEREPVELVVVDDASSDARTAEVLDRLRREGVPVVRHARNLGLPAARMTGLRASRRDSRIGGRICESTKPRSVPRPEAAG